MVVVLSLSLSLAVFFFLGNRLNFGEDREQGREYAILRMHVDSHAPSCMTIDRQNTHSLTHSLNVEAGAGASGITL